MTYAFCMEGGGSAFSSPSFPEHTSGPLHACPDFYSDKWSHLWKSVTSVVRKSGREAGPLSRSLLVCLHKEVQLCLSQQGDAYLGFCTWCEGGQLTKFSFYGSRKGNVKCCALLSSQHTPISLIHWFLSRLVLAANSKWGWKIDHYCSFEHRDLSISIKITVFEADEVIWKKKTTFSISAQKYVSQEEFKHCAGLLKPFFFFSFFLRGSTDDLFSGSTGHSVLKVETCFTSLAMEKPQIVRCICHLKHHCLMDGNGFKAGWMVLVLLVEYLAAAQIKRRRAPVWWKPQPHLCFGFLSLSSSFSLTYGGGGDPFYGRGWFRIRNAKIHYKVAVNDLSRHSSLKVHQSKYSSFWKVL